MTNDTNTACISGRITSNVVYGSMANGNKYVTFLLTSMKYYEDDKGARRSKATPIRVIRYRVSEDPRLDRGADILVVGTIECQNGGAGPGNHGDLYLNAKDIAVRGPVTTVATPAAKERMLL